MEVIDRAEGELLEDGNPLFELARIGASQYVFEVAFDRMIAAAGQPEERS